MRKIYIGPLRTYEDAIFDGVVTVEETEQGLLLIVDFIMHREYSRKIGYFKDLVEAVQYLKKEYLP